MITDRGLRWTIGCVTQVSLSTPRTQVCLLMFALHLAVYEKETAKGVGGRGWRRAREKREADRKRRGRLRRRERGKKERQSDGLSKQRISSNLQHAN